MAVHSFRLVVCLNIIMTVLGTLALEHYEGDVCKEENGGLWRCLNHTQCPRTEPELTNGTISAGCVSTRGDPLVCCAPEDTSVQTAGNKSKEMCRRYSRLVFIDVYYPLEPNRPIAFDTCSRIESLILVPITPPRKFLHMALIGHGENDSLEWVCEGSLISERFVLTTANCAETPRGTTNIRDPAMIVRLGDYDISKTTDEDQGNAGSVEYEVAERFIHPEFKGNHYHNIALLKLKKDVVMNEYIRPACLLRNHTFANTYAEVSGWGSYDWTGKLVKGNILNSRRFPIIERKICEESLKGLGLPEGIKDESMICAGDLQDREDTWEVSIGAPLQIELKEHYCMHNIIGVKSSSCGGQVPAVYTRVSHYLPWIESIVWP